MLSYYTTLLECESERERFTAIYRANHQRMGRLAVQILGPGPRAEDAVHDAFMKLIRHFDQMRDRPEEQLASWLAVVVKNTALDMLRKEKFETELDGGVWEPAAPEEHGEFHALVDLIRKMPEDYRRVLELRFVTEWSLAEIAEAMDIPVSTVKTRIFRGRRMLIEELRKEGYLDGRACI